MNDIKIPRILRHALNVRVATTSSSCRVYADVLRHALNVRVATAKMHNCA